MTRTLPRGRSGITLMEILISILILGIGMVSLATLFPLGLMRLRTAQRLTRSTYLVESAAADVETRNLLNKLSFRNPYYSPWYSIAPYTPAAYDPWIQDSPSYGGNPYGNPLGVSRIIGPGLPVAYDPLWRWQTNFPDGYYPGAAAEARFGYGQGYVRTDTDGFAAADGLQRITNFRPASSSFNNLAQCSPDIFVSPEDIVWEDSEGKQGASNISPIVPDLLSTGGFQSNLSGTLTNNDWRYSWMFTGQQCDANNGSVFDGDVVVFENRQFGIETGLASPLGAGQTYQVLGEVVVEGIFGFSTNVLVPNGGNQGYSRGADNVVLIRWPAGMPDPIVTVGGWIADVTYTRNQTASNTRQTATIAAVSGLGLNVAPPPQRCHWYQIARKSPPATDATNANFRSMTVWTSTPLRAKTLLTAGTGAPVFFNSVLIAPSVVNVFTKTFYTR